MLNQKAKGPGKAIRFSADFCFPVVVAQSINQFEQELAKISIAP